MNQDTQKNIYQRINEVMKSVRYVQKDKAVQGGGQNYKAVTHDQVVSVARTALVEAGIVIFPNQVSGEFLVLRDMNAKPEPVKMGLYTGTYEINFVNIDNGDDKITVTVQAHANDNGDKAPGKALTYATKSAILKVLNLETGEDDESREEVREKLKTISDEQQEELAKYCYTEENGQLTWTPIGQKLAAAYRIQSLNQLQNGAFDEALKKCKKAAEAANNASNQ